MRVTAEQIARAFEGTSEVPGAADNPQVLAFLRLDVVWPASDEVAWCSGFVNYVVRLLEPAARAVGVNLPRSRSLLARSWLTIGRSVPLDQARRGWDLVILKQSAADPGPEVLSFRGHIGFYVSHGGGRVLLLGGNQSNRVRESDYPVELVLDVRRIFEEVP